MRAAPLCLCAWLMSPRPLSLGHCPRTVMSRLLLFGLLCACVRPWAALPELLSRGVFWRIRKQRHILNACKQREHDTSCTCMRACVHSWVRASMHASARVRVLVRASEQVPDKLIPHIRQQLASGALPTCLQARVPAPFPLRTRCVPCLRAAHQPAGARTDTQRRANAPDKHADVHLQGARVNVDSRRIAMRTQGRPPFDALYVRVRPQIVVDGLVHPEKIAGGVSRGGDCATIDAWAAGSGAGELDWQGRTWQTFSLLCVLMP